MGENLTEKLLRTPPANLQEEIRCNFRHKSFKPLPSLQHCIDDHAVDVYDKKSDCDDGGIISTTPFNILFEKMGDILFSFVMGAPCRLFKSKSPTTLHQENKHVLIDKSYDISSVFFFPFAWLFQYICNDTSSEE